jgi:UDP-N-acetylmuramate--alanine ligase
MEHMDYYKTLEDMIAAYRVFANNTKPGGAICYNFADQNARKALEGFKGTTESFGFSKEAVMHPADIVMDGFRTSYGCIYKDKLLGKVELRIPGMHNVLNSMASVMVGLKLGLDFNRIANSIKDFKGTKRRFHLRAESDGVMLIDDYAHHPTEIRAVLDACKSWKDKRIIVIFQPHRYTRTMHLADEFGRCFGGVNKLILTDIYAASEEPIEGVSVKNIYDRVKKNGISDVVVMDKDRISEHVMKLKKPGDMILVLGAGDIKKVADELSARLNAN